MNEHINPVIFVMGVSGSGKSTIGKLLSLKLSLPYFEGDEYHSPENIAKMSAAQPLTDIDRQVWLESLNQLAINQGKNKGCIIGCSALKEKYRKTLAKGVSQPVYFVFLEGNFEIISQRLQNRKGHFMPPALLQSQFEALQIPENAIKINILDPPEQIVNNIIQNLSHLKNGI